MQASFASSSNVPSSLTPPQAIGAWQRIMPAIVLVYSFMLLAPEVRISLAGLNVYSYRMAILPLLVLVGLRYARGHARGNATDVLVLGASAWMIVSFVAIFDLADGLVRAGALVIDFGGAYFVARASVLNAMDLRRLLVAIAPGIAVAGFLMALESVSHQLIARPFWRSIFGALPQYYQGESVGEMTLRTETRLGLLRGYSMFSHPILGGAVLVSVLPLFFFAGLRGWPKFTGLAAGLAGFFSLSSAAILGLSIVFALAVLELLKRSIEKIRWAYISAVGGVMLLAAHLGTENGIVAVLGRFTINPATAYVRRLQWDYGLAAIEQRPLFGYAYQTIDVAPWMTDSIDAHFLALGIRHGVIVPLLTLLAAFVVLLGVGLKASKDAANRGALVGYNFALFTLVFVGMTVTYFGESNVWFMLVLGIGASLMVMPADQDSAASA